MTQTQSQIENIIAVLDRNLNILNAQVDGLTHEDSLLQLPFRGNCLNWVVGHLTVQRDMMLQSVGEAPVLTEAETELYKTGSQPITDGSKALSLEKLLEILRDNHGILKEKISHFTPDMLNVNVDEDMTLLQLFDGLVWHESYHVGQTEILRQLAGKNDQVV